MCIKRISHQRQRKRTCSTSSRVFAGQDGGAGVDGKVLRLPVPGPEEHPSPGRYAGVGSCRVCCKFQAEEPSAAGQA